MAIEIKAGGMYFDERYIQTLRRNDDGALDQVMDRVDWIDLSGEDMYIVDNDIINLPRPSSWAKREKIRYFGDDAKFILYNFVVGK